MATYLDHAATSPMRPEVRAAFADALGVVGNPASIHTAGQAARDLLEQGRERVAASLGADPVEVVFTGGGTEAVNLGVKGLYWARAADAAALGADRSSRRRILTTRAEHHATIDAVEWLARFAGAEVEWIPVDGAGRIRLDALEASLARDAESVALVSTLWANNEVGTLQPVSDVVAAAARYGVPVHVDAIAAYGSVPIDAGALGAACVSVSAHKIGGPVGIGALVLARSARVEALVHGGDQQRARSGTQDAAAAHAFGVAAELATGGAGSPAVAAHAARVAPLRDRLAAGIRSIPGAVLRGDADAAGRLPGNVHATFDGCEGDSLLFLLDAAGVQVSTGSACTSGVPEASHVLLAMGLDEPTARGALRFTLGPDSTDAEIDGVLAVLPGIVERARAAGLAARAPSLGR